MWARPQRQRSLGQRRLRGRQKSSQVSPANASRILRAGASGYSLSPAPSGGEGRGEGALVFRECSLSAPKGRTLPGPLLPPREEREFIVVIRGSGRMRMRPLRVQTVAAAFQSVPGCVSLWRFANLRFAFLPSHTGLPCWATRFHHSSFVIRHSPPMALPSWRAFRAKRDARIRSSKHAPDGGTASANHQDCRARA